MTIQPREPYLSDETSLAALCIWREARCVRPAGKLGVYWVLRNRCAMAPAQGFKPSISGNVLKPFAFSSFNADDPNSTLYPEPTDPSWIECLRAVASKQDDPTGGAVFYFSGPQNGPPPHAWGSVNHLADIGNLHFYGIPPTVTT